jgi:hypothetical protein
MRAVGGLLLLAFSGCNAEAATVAPDAAAPCTCDASGMIVHVDYDTITEYCPVRVLGVEVASARSNPAASAVRCRDPGPLAQGARLVVPWPAGVHAGDPVAVRLTMSGDSATTADGEAEIRAAPEGCTAVVVHARCRPPTGAGATYP